jgi:hypothetical protein
MSYVLTPYLVDFEALGRGFGSRDESLISAVIESNPKPFAASDGDGEGGVTLRKALEDLVMGNAPAEDSDHRYFRALMLLCKHLGAEVILPNAWGGVRWIAVRDVGLEDVMKRGFPESVAPTLYKLSVIGYMTAEEVQAKIKELSGARPKVKDEDLEELFEEYKGWLHKAGAKKKGIIFFYG